jgi:hypothetical protein
MVILDSEQDWIRISMGFVHSESESESGGKKKNKEVKD